MKKFLIALMLCLVSSIGFCQDWDSIGKNIFNNEMVVHYERQHITRHKIRNHTIKNREYKKTIIYNYLDTRTGIKFQYQTMIDTSLQQYQDYVFLGECEVEKPIIGSISKSGYLKEMPIHKTKDPIIDKVILDNYLIGDRCYKSGQAIIIIGSIVTFISLPFVFYDVKKNENGVIIKSTSAGIACAAIGGTLISVSLPLLCFGDHIKRETNMIYSVLK